MLKQSNVTPLNRTGEDQSTIQWLDADTVYPTELVDGRVLLDEWVCNRHATVELIVDYPHAAGPMPSDENKPLRLTKSIRRRYVFEPGVTIRIPAMYRLALQTIHGNVVVGGMLPFGRRLNSTESPVIHPALIDNVGPLAPAARPNGTEAEPAISSALAPPDDLSAEDRALKRARLRRGA